MAVSASDRSRHVGWVCRIRCGGLARPAQDEPSRTRKGARLENVREDRWARLRRSTTSALARVSEGWWT